MNLTRSTADAKLSWERWLISCGHYRPNQISTRHKAAQERDQWRVKCGTNWISIRHKSILECGPWMGSLRAWPDQHQMQSHLGMCSMDGVTAGPTGSVPDVQVLWNVTDGRDHGMLANTAIKMEKRCDCICHWMMMLLHYDVMCYHRVFMSLHYCQRMMSVMIILRCHWYGMMMQWWFLCAFHTDAPSKITHFHTNQCSKIVRHM